MRDVLLKQLNRVDLPFDSFAAPTGNVQTIMGRVCNMSTEDPKLRDFNIGLINVDEEM